MLLADAHREGRGAVAEALGVGDAVQAHARELVDPLQESPRQRALVSVERRETGEDRRAPIRTAASDPRDVVDRRDRARERLVALCACLPAIGILVGCGAKLVGRERGQQLRANAEHALVGTEVLVGRRGDDVGADPWQVDGMVLRVMYAVDGDQRPDRLCPCGQIGGRRHGAEGVGGEREGDELRAIGQLRVERIEIQRAVVGPDVHPTDGGARITRGEQPRPDVRVVVQPCHDDLVSRPPRPSDRARQMQQQRRRVLAEDHLARVAAKEVCPRPPRVGDQRVDLLARREHAVGVRRAGAHATGHRCDRRVHHL